MAWLKYLIKSVGENDQIFLNLKFRNYYLKKAKKKMVNFVGKIGIGPRAFGPSIPKDTHFVYTINS